MLHQYIDVLLNLILVENNVRPACMIQMCNYGENKYTDPIISSILHEVKLEFPALIHSYDIQGVIISKSYNGNSNPDKPSALSSPELGKILGYPCYDYAGYYEDIDEYVIDIYVQLEDERWIHLIANRCHNTEKIKEFEEIATNAYRVLKGNARLDVKIEQVRVYVNKNPSLSSIIKKLQTITKLNPDEHHKIQNIFYNMFSGDKEIKYDETNMIHRGIIIGILLTIKHDTISPFYPLSSYPDKQKEVEEISYELKKELEIIFSS